MAFKVQFKGIALIAHGLASGMDDWPIRRWRRDLSDIKAMGADTVWYTPVQYGRFKASEVELNSPLMQHQRAIHQAAAGRTR